MARGAYDLEPDDLARPSVADKMQADGLYPGWYLEVRDLVNGKGSVHTRKSIGGGIAGGSGVFRHYEGGYVSSEPRPGSSYLYIAQRPPIALLSGRKHGPSFNYHMAVILSSAVAWHDNTMYKGHTVHGVFSKCGSLVGHRLRVESEHTGPIPGPADFALLKYNVFE